MYSTYNKYEKTIVEINKIYEQKERTRTIPFLLIN